MFSGFKSETQYECSFLHLRKGEWSQQTDILENTGKTHFNISRLDIFNKIFMRSREQEDLQMETRIS